MGVNMSRKLALFMILILVCNSLPSSAANNYVTLPNLKLQAEQGWKRQYEVSGRKLKVDIVPQLPDVEKVPLLEIVLDAANIVQPLPNDNWVVNHNHFTGFVITHHTNKAEEPAGAITWKGKSLSAKPYRTYREQVYAPASMLIPGNLLRFDEVCTITREALRLVNIPEDFIDIPSPDEIQAFGYYQDNANDQFLSPGWASISWRTQLHGIKVMSYPSVPFKQGKNEPAFLFPHIGIVIRRMDLFYMAGQLLEIKGLMESDLPLLSFDRVIKGYEKEIQAGRVRHVFDLQFEYVLQPAPGTKPKLGRDPDDKYIAKPYWRLECLWGEKASAEDILPETDGNGPYPDPYNNRSRVSLLMDAQTGEILNPLSERQDRAIFKGAVTWADIGGKD